MTNTKPDSSFHQAVRDLLADRACAVGLSLDDRQLDRFALFADCLRDGNRRINLTAITDVEGVVLKHFLDSMAAWPALSRELEDLKHEDRLAVLDVGTGAGLPGLALAILDPAIQLTLMDGTLRKVDFLTGACRTLGMVDVAVVHGRAEELGRQPAFRERFPVVVARGLAPLPTLLEYLVPLTCVGGLCLAYKGPNLPVELQAARPAMQALRVDVERVLPVHVPGLDAVRRVAVFRKTRATADKYPRGQGLPRRRPLQA